VTSKNPCFNLTSIRTPVSFGFGGTRFDAVSTLVFGNDHVESVGCRVRLVHRGAMFTRGAPTLQYCDLCRRQRCCQAGFGLRAVERVLRSVRGLRLLDASGCNTTAPPAVRVDLRNTCPLAGSTSVVLGAPVRFGRRVAHARRQGRSCDPRRVVRSTVLNRLRGNCRRLRQALGASEGGLGGASRSRRTRRNAEAKMANASTVSRYDHRCGSRRLSN